MTRPWKIALSCGGAMVVVVISGVVGFVALLVFLFPVDESQLERHPDLAYGTDSRQRLDLVFPKTRGDHFGIVLVHGGGWSAGSRRDMADMANFFAKQGYLVANVEYRLATPSHSAYPAAVDDVQQAVRWLRAHSAEYHLISQPLGAVGGSAGGHLVALLGTCDTLHDNVPELSTYSSRVQAVIDISGPTDLTADFTGYGIGSLPSSQIIHDFIGADPAAAMDVYRQASPLFHVDARSARFLICHGDADVIVPVDQSKKFYERLRAQGIAAELVIYPRQGHGFDTATVLKFILRAHFFFHATLVPPAL